MIESVEDFISMVENSDRSAITEKATEGVWVSILNRRPDLAVNVAMNKHLPASILDQLISSDCSEAKAFVAMKRSLTEEQFLKLSLDKDESVRNLVASNRKTPFSILERLATDECEIVSHSAREQLQARTR